MMKLKFFCSVAIFICIFSLSHSVYGASLQSGFIEGDNVNVRSGPGLDTDIICRLQQGVSVGVVEQSNGWLKVQFADDQTGWVRQQFIEIKSPSEVEQQTSLKMLPINDILSFAHSLIGISYIYGGASIRGFDCSGFTMYVLAKFGIQLPHEASQQMEMGLPVSSITDLVPGDLVFFRTLSSKVVNHVGIYLGNNLFIHAASGFGMVRISNLEDSYYLNCYVGARRLQNIHGDTAG